VRSWWTASLVGIIAMAALVATGLGPAQADTPADERIQRQVASLATAPALGSSLGVAVTDVSSTRAIAGVAAKRGFIPASTLKVITAFTSVSALGKDHRFITRTWSSSRGRLILEGGGDPVLAEADLERLAHKTRRALLTRDLPLRVVVDFDDDLFGLEAAAPGWESGDLPTYAAPVRGLALLGSYTTDPGRVAATRFVQALSQRGVSAVLGERADAQGTMVPLARIAGNDVTEAVQMLLPPSENNIAEVLFRHVALATQRPPTWLGAKRATRAVLKEGDLWRRGTMIVDGSGLSYANRVSPRLLTDVLTRIDSDPRLAVIGDSLPIAGVGGTLVRRFASWPASCASGEVAAKTGSLPMSVSTLAGLTTGADGRRKAFAIMVNDRPSTSAWSATSHAIDTMAAAVHGCVP
jgi:serine-type D-Ala-D-Ala carboxypeptidase/endopeptidase (penicillin-binding protein 4)